VPLADTAALADAVGLVVELEPAAGAEEDEDGEDDDEHAARASAAATTPPVAATFFVPRNCIRKFSL